MGNRACLSRAKWADLSGEAPQGQGRPMHLAVVRALTRSNNVVAFRWLPCGRTVTPTALHAMRRKAALLPTTAGRFRTPPGVPPDRPALSNRHGHDLRRALTASSRRSGAASPTGPCPTRRANFRRRKQLKRKTHSAEGCELLSKVLRHLDPAGPELPGLVGPCRPCLYRVREIQRRERTDPRCAGS